jgi:hypothetical protein
MSSYREGDMVYILISPSESIALGIINGEKATKIADKLQTKRDKNDDFDEWKQEISTIYGGNEP